MSAPARARRPCMGDLLCRECAAEALGVGVDSFDRHVRARHTRLTQIGERGELLSVMSQAGHMSPQTANKYLHPSLAHARRGNRQAP